MHVFSFESMMLEGQRGEYLYVSRLQEAGSAVIEINGEYRIEIAYGFDQSNVPNAFYTFNYSNDQDLDIGKYDYSESDDEDEDSRYTIGKCTEATEVSKAKLPKKRTWLRRLKVAD